MTKVLKKSATVITHPRASVFPKTLLDINTGDVFEATVEGYVGGTLILKKRVEYGKTIFYQPKIAPHTDETIPANKIVKIIRIL